MDDGSDEIREHCVALAGGEFAVSELGDPAGWPLVYCHGGLNSRRDIHFAAAVARRLGVRILAIDRPGIGGSSPQRQRTFSSWGEDVGRIADALELDRFAVLGWSFGGPYALACASALGARVGAVGIVGGMTPLDRPGKADELGTATGRRLLRWAPDMPRAAAAFLASTKVEPAGILFRQIRSELAEPDAKILDGLGPREAIAPFREAIRHTRLGSVQDYQLMSADWGFALGAIEAPVRWWHGAEDTFVPLAHARELAARIPGSKLVVISGAGHYVLRRETGTILTELARAFKLEPSGDRATSPKH
jgi:pimeloyl-ACP methyl ester carboxylesterase